MALLSCGGSVAGEAALTDGPLAILLIGHKVRILSLRQNVLLVHDLSAAAHTCEVAAAQTPRISVVINAHNGVSLFDG